MFGGFFFGVLGIYLLYYVGMIGYDLYVAEKMNTAENVSKEIDIAAAASSYKATDVKSMFEGEKVSNEKVSETDDTNAGGQGEYISNEYQDGYEVDTLAALFEQESQTPSLFAGMQMSM